MKSVIENESPLASFVYRGQQAGHFSISLFTGDRKAKNLRNIVKRRKREQSFKSKREKGNIEIYLRSEIF